MKRRIGLLLVVFLVCLGVGSLGPVFLERRRAELEVRAWYREALDEPFPWASTPDDEARAQELQFLRGALDEAFRGYQERGELSLDAFPNETIVEYLRRGVLPIEERERDVSEYVLHLEGLVAPHAELLSEPSFRPSRIPELASLEEFTDQNFDYIGVRIWQDVLIFHAASQPEDPEALAGLGLALDLARLCDTGVLVGFLVRGGLEVEVLETLHYLLQGEDASAVRLRETLEPRLVRSARPGMEQVVLEVEWRLMFDAFSAFLGEEPICAGFAGDYRPILAHVESLEAVLERGEIAPRAYLAHARGIETPSTFEDYQESTQFQFALIQLARIELALAVYEEREGAWPQSLADLDELFPDGRPRDPHTGEDFPYSREKEGIVLGPPAIGELDERGDELVRRLP